MRILHDGGGDGDAKEAQVSRAGKGEKGVEGELTNVEAETDQVLPFENWIQV